MADDILETKITPFYLRKITAYHRCLDVEGKGSVTKADFQAFVERYQQLSGHDSIRERQMRRKMMKLWDDYFEETSKRVSLTPEIFAKCIAYRGRDQVLSSATHFADFLFDLIDVNADGMINQKEFLALHKLLRRNEKTAAVGFKALNPDEKGFIGYDAFVKAVIKYFLAEVEEETPDTLVFGPLEG